MALTLLSCTKNDAPADPQNVPPGMIRGIWFNNACWSMSQLCYDSVSLYYVANRVDSMVSERMGDKYKFTYNNNGQIIVRKRHIVAQLSVADFNMVIDSFIYNGDKLIANYQYRVDKVTGQSRFHFGFKVDVDPANGHITKVYEGVAWPGTGEKHWIDKYTAINYTGENITNVTGYYTNEYYNAVYSNLRMPKYLKDNFVQLLPMLFNQATGANGIDNYLFFIYSDQVPSKLSSFSATHNFNPAVFPNCPEKIKVDGTINVWDPTTVYKWLEVYVDGCQ